MDKLIFDHAHKQSSFRSYCSLEKYGLRINPDYTTAHPPKDTCRFSFFENGYLEFIEEKTFFGPLKRLSATRRPGLCFKLSEGSLESFSKKAELQKFCPTLSRRAYNWKEGESGPGWKFLSFDTPIFPGIDIWCIEYESSGKTSVRIQNDGQVSEESLLYKNSSDISNFEDFTGVTSENDCIQVEGLAIKFIKKKIGHKPTAIDSISVGISSLENEISLL